MSKELNYREQPINFDGQSPENPERKCLWVLCIDTSISMEPQMSQLYEALHEFKNAVSEDTTAAERIEVAVVEFNQSAKVVSPPGLIEDFEVPQFVLGPSTFMVEGLNKGIELLDARVNWYRQTNQSFFQPFLVLITDGEPNGPGSIPEIANTIKNRVNHQDLKSKFFFRAFGVDGANRKQLEQIATNPEEVLMVKGTDFGSLFRYLSTSIKIIARLGDDATDEAKQVLQDKADEFQEAIQ